MQPNFHFADYAILILYFTLTMGIGFAAFKKGSSVEGFIGGKRNISGIFTGLSILGSFVSSITFLAVPGKAYAANWNPFVWSLAMPLATIISVKYFLPFYRKAGSFSAYEHLEKRFGAWARTYCGVCYLLTQLSRMGAVTYLMALPMSVLFGWNLTSIIIFTGFAVTVYTIAGGIVAVIWTEALQSLVLIGGILLCGAILTFSLPDGFNGILQVASENNKFSLGSFSVLEIGKETFWLVLIYGFFINLQNFGIDQNYVQRYVTAKNDYEAKKGLWIGGLVYLPLSAVFFYVGTALFCYYKAYPELLGAEYAAKPDFIFPYFMVTQLPVGIKGLLIAAVFAAAMSTSSCSLNSSATVLLADFYDKIFTSEKAKKRRLLALRLITLVWGLLGTMMALLFIQFKNTLDAWWILAGIFSGGMLGLFLLGMISKKANNFSASIAVCLGLILIAWMSIANKVDFLPSCPLHHYFIPILGTSVIFVSGFLLAQIKSRLRTHKK